MIQIQKFYDFGNNRIEVTLTNGQKLTLMVNAESGKVSILSDSPHMVGNTVDVVQKSGPWVGEAMPQNIIEVVGYGYPSD